MKVVVGVLSFHGDVIEHIDAASLAIKKLRAPVEIIPVRTCESLTQIHALIIPGGESTTLHKLCVREGMWDAMKTIPFVFGTCAGAIMLAIGVKHQAVGQETLERMHIVIDRNAYGRQTDSFQEPLQTTLGTVDAVYIRAPKILSVKNTVVTLAARGTEVLACEEITNGLYSMAVCFHPELTTTVFHEYFIQKVLHT